MLLLASQHVLWSSGTSSQIVFGLSSTTSLHDSQIGKYRERQRGRTDIDPINERLPQQPVGYRESTLAGSEASFHLRTEPSSARLGSSVTLVHNIEIPGVKKFISGKVREVFDLDQSLLVVATDRLSAFDVILPTGIPHKGKVLTQLSRFWFQKTQNIVPNHLISIDQSVIDDAIAAAGGTVNAELSAALNGRSMLVKKAKSLPVECVARGYMSGSLWKEYKTCFAHGGTVNLHGVSLPVGLRESDKFTENIFTPASKAHSGHDENVSFVAIAETVGSQTAAILKKLTLDLYSFAADFAQGSGIIIADTKLEFGFVDDKLILIDEVLTPDSSRFWDKDLYSPGHPQPSFDKQFVRDYLETLDWDKTYPGPELPDDIVQKTSDKYLGAYSKITGTDL
jgi:phosphoribosylaminoimidazole-succinocarboxamide synthase